VGPLGGDRGPSGPALVFGLEVRPAWRLRTLVGRFDPLTGLAADIDLTGLDSARKVSRRHAELIWAEGATQLRDLGSTNGTSVNACRLEAFKPTPLGDGDVVELGGVSGTFSSHAPWPEDLVPEWDARTLTGSLAGLRDAQVEASIGTLMFGDLVGSTREAVRMGGRAWSSLLGDFYTLTQRSVTRHRGREIRRMGDGVLSTFDSPEAGLRCAMDIRERVRELSLELRCGLHYGEFESIGGELSGAAVHVASRICDRAVASEILVSRTIVELAVGSGVAFSDRGAHSLKGVPGRWRLYSIAGNHLPNPS
jgi:class 3 adenylate cyclase